MTGENSDLSITAVRGIPEVAHGDDLAALIAAHLDRPLRAYDVVVVTSKVVSKALGLVSRTERESLVDEATERVVARRGTTRIVRTKHGLTMAAAGIDASNVEIGSAITLPADPDAAAAALRTSLLERFPDAAGGLGVVVTDTAGRPWRIGQTDLAIGCAGLLPLRSYEGQYDAYGNELRVTAPAIADEVAAAADLVTGKVTGLPVAVVRGLAAAYFCGDNGPGATALVRDDDGDLFGLGANEAVRQAIGTSPGRPRGFADLDDDVVGIALEPVDSEVLSVEVNDESITVAEAPGADRSECLVAYGALLERFRVLDRAYGTSHSTRLLREL